MMSSGDGIFDGGGMGLRWPEGTRRVVERNEHLVDLADGLVCFTVLGGKMVVRFLTEAGTEIWEESSVQERLDRLVADSSGTQPDGGFWEIRARLAESLLNTVSVGMGVGDNDMVDGALRRWRVGL